MSGETIITEELIESLKTPAGAWTRKTLAMLGVSWPPASGWKRRIIGTRVILPDTVTVPQATIHTPAKPDFAGIKVEGVLHFDGSCNPNPGPARAAFVLKYGGKIVERSIDLGQGTCNIAEYHALIEGLTAAQSAGITHLEVYGDSELVIRGVTTRKFSAKNKPHLEALKRQAIDLIDKFYSVDLNWIPRGENAEADEISR